MAVMDSVETKSQPTAVAIPVSMASVTALWRFVSDDLLAWFTPYGKCKSLHRQVRESMDLWRRYKFPPIQYFQSDLYLQDVGETYSGHFPSLKAEQFCVEINGANIDWLEDKVMFDARMREMNLPYIPLMAVITLKTGTIGVRDADGAALDLRALHAMARTKGYARVFVKPRHGVGGSGAFSLSVTEAGFEREGKPADEAFLATLMSEHSFVDYVVQPFFYQHEALSALNPSSVNTVRVHTFLANDEVEVFAPYIRCGTGEHETDNSSRGGYSAGVCLRSGALTTKGRQWPGPRLGDELHPHTKVPFRSVKLPFANEISEICVRGARSFAPIRIIGWDIAIGKDGPCIIEANIYPGLRGVQDLCGPLADTTFGQELRKAYGWR